MRRKNRIFVAAAVAVYIFLLGYAYHWGATQRLPDGSIFDHIENEAKRKALAASAAEVAVVPPSTPESRLNAGGPIFVAVRYDATHVAFMAGPGTEPRFPDSNFGHKTPARKVPPAQRHAAQLAALEELWEPAPGSPSLAGLPENVKRTQPGDSWLLQVSQDFTVPAIIERPVVAPTGCSLSAGFLAAVSPEQQAAFAASPREYFIIRRSSAQSVEPPQLSGAVSELPAWKLTPEFEKQLVALLASRMRQEIPPMETRLLADAQRPNGDSWIASATRSRLQRWKQFDTRLLHGEGHIDYDVRAFRLTPDGVPRLYVRARWRMAGETMFLMTVWFRADAKPVLLSADANWSETLREGEVADSAWDGLNFQKILNVFDVDRDGWAELLVYTHDGTSVEIALYLYSDLGMVPTKTSFRRDIRPAESCLDGE